MKKKLLTYLVFALILLVAFKIACFFDLWSNLDSRCIKLPFQSTELAHTFASLVLGLTLKGAPHIKADINILHLFSIVSENGLHFYLLIQSLDYFFPFLKIKKYSLFILLTCIVLTLSPSLIRIFLFKLLLLIQRKYKLKINQYLNLVIVFSISFFLGHFKLSPIGFILSFSFWFCYLWGRHKSRIEQILIVSLICSIIAIYFGESFSIISIFFGIIILWIYIKSYKVLLIAFIYSLIFNKTIPVEFILRTTFKIIHFISHNVLIDSTTSTTLAAVILIWALILKRPYLIFFIFVLRIESANSPTIFLAEGYF